MTAIDLSDEQAKFAADAVAAGRYRDISDVVGAGLAALQRLEAQRANLLQSVQAAEAEGDRDGYLSIAEVEAEMRSLIKETARSGH